MRRFGCLAPGRRVLGEQGRVVGEATKVLSVAPMNVAFSARLSVRIKVTNTPISFGFVCGTSCFILKPINDEFTLNVREVQ